jgi:pimeloyl-ACP methyl ester carboxylesterase
MTPQTIEIKRGLARTSAGTIHYRMAGSGPFVLLLNASGQSSAVCVELMRALAPHACAVAMDYPSHGMSDHVPQPAIEDYARWVIEFMDELGIGQTALMSEATGNGIVLELGGHHADRVTKAILVNCPFHFDESSSTRAHESLKKDLRPTDASGFPLPRTIDFFLAHDPTHAPNHPTQDWMDRINVAQAEAGRDRFQLLNAFGKFDLLAAFEQIKRPVLLLMGEQFHYTQHMEEFRKRIPNLTAEIIPGARFCAMWEYADFIAERTTAFLNR